MESTLPAGTSLRDLGKHRLKDIADPEHLFQLVLPGLPHDFPALRSLDARPNNLPLQLTSFVGREAEITAVGSLLDVARLITLTGPGGTGKTRLALQIAAQRLGSHPDGVFFVELAPISDPDLVASAIAAALLLREVADQPIVETTKQALRDRDLLLVLDNFEQVADAAPLVGELLAGADRLRIIVTSRAVLRLRGEHEYPVPPLRIPDPATLPTLEAISQFEGVRLFVERALASRPDFTITNESASAVAEIIARLDGLPLAIELAAAKVKALGPEAILARLASRLTFLAGGPRDLPARQQTLRQAIDWSYVLLPSEQQGLLRRLAVFVGGCTLEDASAVCHPQELGLDAEEGLAALLDQSLVRWDEAPHGEARYMLLETIREFALERLREADEANALRRRHALHFTTVAEETEPSLTSSPNAIERVGRDHDNFRAALAWAIESDEADVALRLGFALWRFWQLRNHLAEARGWFDRILTLPGSAVPSRSRAKGLTGAAGIAYWRNDYAAADAWYSEAEVIVRETGDLVWLADALYNSGTVTALRGDIETTMAKIREGQSIGRTLGDDAILGRFLDAEGYIAFMGDDLDRARTLLEEAVSLSERGGHPQAIATHEYSLAQVARLQGRLGEAADRYRRSLRYAAELGDKTSLIEPLQGMGAVAVASGNPDVGVRLLAATKALRERLGASPPPEWQRLGDPFNDARTALGDVAYERAWQAGLAMTAEEAIGAALAQLNGAEEEDVS